MVKKTKPKGILLDMRKVSVDFLKGVWKGMGTVSTAKKGKGGKQ